MTFKRLLQKLGWALARDFMQRRNDRAIPFWFPEDFKKTRSIFVHVPRTGGTSIAMTLYGRQVPHTTWQTWVSLFPPQSRDYYSFAVVREPIERFLSTYDFLKRGGMSESDKKWAADKLADFKLVEELIDSLADQQVRKQIFSRWHFCPQSDFLDARLGEPCIKQLIPFENLADGFRIVAKALGRDLVLPHLNASVKESNRNLSSAHISFLNELYQRDRAFHELALKQRKRWLVS